METGCIIASFRDMICTLGDVPVKYHFETEIYDYAGRYIGSWRVGYIPEEDRYLMLHPRSHSGKSPDYNSPNVGKDKKNIRGE